MCNSQHCSLFVLIADYVCKRGTFYNPDIRGLLPYSIMEPANQQTMTVTVLVSYVTGIKENITDGNVCIVAVGRTRKKSGTPTTSKVTGETAVADNSRATDLTNQTAAVTLAVFYAGSTETAC